MGNSNKPRVRLDGEGNVIQFRTTNARYEAAQPSRLRNFYRERGTQNELVQRDAVALRDQARHLARNHDLAKGMLELLVNNVVGAKGIGVEPQPRRADGSIHTDYAKDLMEAYRDWCRKPEVTGRHSWAKSQRLIAKAWIRDGDGFAQHVIGPGLGLVHGTRVPYSLELFETDLVPLDLNDQNNKILQGIEMNAWGRPTALHVVKTQPWLTAQPYSRDTKRIPWERVLHIASLDHIGQLRGVSRFASVITRLEDIKDYEESERVAAKIAAMLTAAITKGDPQSFTGSDYERDSNGDIIPREIGFSAGMIIDDLMPGEKIELLDSKRPNPNLITFRSGQLRAVAAGFGTSYSSSAKDYNGTFSAQRQELVEQWIHYAVMTDDFVTDISQPVWENFVMASHLSGVVPMPRDLKPGTHDDAMYIGQSMPWIDPLKEALAWQALVEAGFASEVEVMRKRGVSPHDVLEQVDAWRKDCADKGIAFKTDPVGLEKLLAVSGME